jgi:hypothetical protein
MLAPVLAAALSVFALSSASDSSAIVPSFQTLDVEIDPGSKRWSGSLQTWLLVRRPVRLLTLALAGPVVSRVEINVMGGAAELLYGERPPGVLTIEARAPLRLGRGAMNVSFAGAIADSGRGLARTRAGGVALARGDGIAFPAWPPGTPATRWSVVVHAPAGCRVTCALPLRGTSRQGGWETWTYVSPKVLRASDVAFEVRPPRAAKGAARK